MFFAKAGAGSKEAPASSLDSALSLFRSSPDVLDRTEACELDVVQLALHPIDLANVDVVDDVAGLWIDRHRSARAFPSETLHCRNQGSALGRAVCFRESLINEVHAVIAAHRH